MKKTKEQISYNMRQVKYKDSKIECLLREGLWSNGYRYQKNVKTIMGKPDIVFKGCKVAVFCDSEFWHGYDWEKRKSDIKSNRNFWIKKIERNMDRDTEVNKALKEEGWTVIRFWGNEITENAEECTEKVMKAVDFKKAQGRGKHAIYNN